MCGTCINPHILTLKPLSSSVPRVPSPTWQLLTTSPKSPLSVYVCILPQSLPAPPIYYPSALDLQAHFDAQAGGNSGRFMAAALLKTGKHTVTALTRADSQSSLADGIIVKQVDYSNPQTLVDALHGQDALIITLSGITPTETQTQLIEAAGKAGVQWIFPNEWSPDTANEALVKDVFVFQPKGEFALVQRQTNSTSHLLTTSLSCFQTLLERPSRNWAKATISPSPPAFGTSGVWPCPRRTVSTLPTAP